MTEHDGWVLKGPAYRKSKGYFMPSFFNQFKREVIKQIDNIIAEGYEKWKKGKGKEYKIVKVKFMEVK